MAILFLLSNLPGARKMEPKRKVKIQQKGALFTMGKPKKRTSSRRTGTRRSHLVVKLGRQVNAASPVKTYTTRREAGKKLAEKAV